MRHVASFHLPFRYTSPLFPDAILFSVDYPFSDIHLTQYLNLKFSLSFSFGPHCLALFAIWWLYARGSKISHTRGNV